MREMTLEDGSMCVCASVCLLSVCLYVVCPSVCLYVDRPSVCLCLCVPVSSVRVSANEHVCVMILCVLDSLGVYCLHYMACILCVHL